MIEMVNDIAIYYEEYGSGKPIIMLHGNGESHHIYDAVARKLASKYRVYLVDSRGHGNSSRNVRLSYDLMALDIENLIIALKIKSPIIYGFSDGGIVALLMAIRNRVELEKIIISGANLEPNGLKDELLIETRLDYEKTKNPLSALMLNEPHITLAELKKIKIPTHIIVGEDDVVKKEHSLKIYDGINDATLLELSGENHYSYVMNNDKLYRTLIKYL